MKRNSHQYRRQSCGLSENLERIRIGNFLWCWNKPHGCHKEKSRIRSHLHAKRNRVKLIRHFYFTQIFLILTNTTINFKIIFVTYKTIWVFWTLYTFLEEFIGEFCKIKIRSHIWYPVIWKIKEAKLIIPIIIGVSASTTFIKICYGTNVSK